jgi:hypothetical protein
VLLLFGETGFVGGARFSCWLSLLLNRQGPRNELGKPPLGRLSIAKLAARIACDDPNFSFFVNSLYEARKQKIALFGGECYRCSDIPQNFYT